MSAQAQPANVVVSFDDKPKHSPRRHHGNGKNRKHENKQKAYLAKRESEKQAVQGSIKKAQETGDWVYAAADVERYKFLFDRDVMQAFLEACPEAEVRRTLVRAALALAEREIRKDGIPAKKRLYLAQHMLTLSSWRKGMPSRLEGVIELIGEVFEDIPQGLFDRSMNLLQKKREYDRRNGNASPSSKVEPSRHPKKKRHSHPIRHLTDEQKAARNAAAKQRKRNKGQNGKKKEK